MLSRDERKGFFRNPSRNPFASDGWRSRSTGLTVVFALPGVPTISGTAAMTAPGRIEEEAQPNCASATTAPANEPRLIFPPSGSVRVPFRKGVNHVIVDATDGNNAAYVFVIDTGASYSVVTPSFVATQGSAGKSMCGAALAEGAHGAIAALPQLHSISGLRIGDLVIEEAGMMSIDLAPVSQRLGYEVHGIIGYNILSRMVTLVDYAGGQVVFALPDNSKPFKELGNPLHVVPFRLLLGAMIEVRGQVNNEDPWPFLVDLGAQISMITPEAVQKARVRPNPKPVQLPTMGLGTDIEEAGFLRADVSSLRFGSLAFEKTILYQASLPVFKTLGYEGKPAGILGNDLMGFYRLAIDYGRSELRFWNRDQASQY